MSAPDLIAAGVVSAAAVTLDRTIQWLRGRHKDSAETGLTVDQRWERYADQIETRMKSLEHRVDELEADLEQARDRVKGLTAEVDRYKAIAKSLSRHVLRLRDALARAGGTLPAIPADIENALTVIDLP